MNIDITQYELAEQEYANSFISIRELAEKYNIQRQVFTGWLLAKGWPCINRRAKRSFNTDYFDCIDTEEKAYWLGFLFADGALTQYAKSYDIELSLKIDDADHVRKFAKAIGKKYVNCKSTYRCRCSIGSKHMFETLSSYGCTPKKSLTLKFPSILIFKYDHLIRHFIRGYVDGDGCISYQNKEHTRMSVSVLGTKDFLDGIQRCFNTSKNYSNNAKGQDITKVLQYNGRSGLQFLHWLYEDATIYLERKKERYLEYCRLYEESCRLPEDKIGESCDANTEVTSKIT